MIKASQISTEMVTGMEIGKCHKIFEGSTPVWMVESQSDETVEYRVKHNVKQGFTCSCKAGSVGFSNCKAGYCKHVAWAVAAEAELRTAMKELEIAIAVQAAMSDQETIKAAELAREAPEKVSRKRETACIERKSFSILR